MDFYSLLWYGAHERLVIAECYVVPYPRNQTVTTMLHLPWPNNARPLILSSILRNVDFIDLWIIQDNLYVPKSKRSGVTTRVSIGVSNSLVTPQAGPKS